jgi:branched-chain amino acid transport system substrate-binding protein
MDLHDLAARAGTPEAVKSVFVGAFLREPIESPQMATYNNLFHKYYPSERLQTSVYFLSAGAEVIIEALKRAGRDLTRAKFVAELEKLKGFRSTFNACDISFSAESHEGCLTGTMWRLINNKIVNVGPVWTADSK